MTDARETKDVPSSEYWSGAERGELVLQRCSRCGRIRHYPRVLCDVCYSFEVTPVVSGGEGSVHSWTVAHHAYDPAFAQEVPYVLVTVDMQEGVRVLGRITDAASLAIGLPVRIGFERGHDGRKHPVFSMRAGNGGAAEAGG